MNLSLRNASAVSLEHKTAKIRTGTWLLRMFSSPLKSGSDSGFRTFDSEWKLLHQSR